MSNDLAALRWTNSQRRQQVSAELEARRAYNAEHEEIELPPQQEEPAVEAPPQQQIRNLSPEELTRWNAWLDEALQETIDRIHAVAQVAFDNQQKQIDALTAELLRLRADLTRPRSWWSK